MKSGAMTTVLLILLVSLATLFMVESRCDRAPTMKLSDACLKSCNTPSLFNHCQEILQGTPNTAEVNIYALAAAMAAKRSYETTAAAARRLAGDASLPADDRAAYKFCVGNYDAALKSMDGVIHDMSRCVFQSTLWYYVACDRGLWHCEDALSTLKDSPLLKMNVADRELLAVAQALGSLIVGRVAT
ncbi:hypothetical protein QOZ80_8BG0644540 [Eleusine coracana subsp. coracana]|nr:hypothetical protein QOZ80_8BG0644540 [Eleusine coracana subsp. coracana]